MIKVEKCLIPASTTLDQRWIAEAFFKDAYRATMKDPNQSVTSIFVAVFAYHPLTVKLLLILRNTLVKLIGLDAPTYREIMTPGFKSSYQVGEKIGPWPIFYLDPQELIAGRNNHHLDFRLSILKETRQGHQTCVISTVCSTHNTFGKLYLMLIIPFHKMGVRFLIRRALSSGRL